MSYYSDESYSSSYDDEPYSQQRTSTDNCPGRHGLTETVASHRNIICDACERNLRRGQKVFQCDACDYDLCNGCFDGTRKTYNRVRNRNKQVARIVKTAKYTDNCPGRHGLMETVTPKSGCYCDACNSNLRWGQKVFHC
eukprot:UN23550